MATGVNKVILLGRLGKEPESQQFESGKKTSFPLATSEVYKDKNGNRQESTDWHNIVLWRGLAEIAEQYLHKGDLVYLEGKIKSRSYEDNGIKKYITEILGDNLVMLGKSSSNYSESVETKSMVAEDNNNNEEMPF